ncbi:MAG TPA: HAD family hydrolase [Longimicrobiales bacterium]|nr:HAD family hydrolase [Longimicrobiales bacterium]
MSIDVVLFDLDGTLFESQGLYGEAYRRAVLPLLERPLTRDDLQRIRPRSESAFFSAAVPESQRPAALEAFRREYRALHETRFGGLFDGVHDLLTGVAALGLRRGIVSGKSRGSWEITSAIVGLAQGFDVVVLDDDVTRPKPDPQGIVLAVERLALAPARAVYIGDTASDMEAAAAAGAWPMLATWAPGDSVRRTRALDAARAHGAAVAATPGEALRHIRGRRRGSRGGPSSP